MTPAEVMQLVADKSGLTVEQVQGRCRKQPIIFAKWITIALLMKMGQKPKNIVVLFPQHSRCSTINYARDVFEDLLTYKPFRDLYEECEKECRIDDFISKHFKTL